MKQRYLIFTRNGHNYACIFNTVVEICREFSGFIKPPATPNFIYGLFNLRGEITTMLDIATLAESNSNKLEASYAIIINDGQNNKSSLVADEIVDITDWIEINELPTPSHLSENFQKLCQSFIQINNELIVVLDSKQVIHELH